MDRFPKISNYRILCKIGEGSMSEVFKAQSLKDESQYVAIKVLRQFFKSRDSYVTRLKKEAQTMRLLQDDRIVKCLDVLRTKEGLPCLICELVEGENLEEIRGGSNDLSICSYIGAAIVSEVLLGLEESHRQGIVHRDLKPENILLSGEARIKITDFGVAKNLESQEATVTGMVMGSPAYMSPEQLLGQKIDERSDLFSLGVMLYYFSTGELPFVGNNYGELSQKIFKGEFKSPEKINPNIHPQLVLIIRKSLSSNKESRYQKAYEFRFDLMKWMDELCLPSVREILIGFRQNEDLAFLEKNRLVSTLIVRAIDAEKDKLNLLKMTYLQQVLTIDPENQEAKNLLRTKNTQVVRVGALAIFLVVLIAAITKLDFSENKFTSTGKSKKTINFLPIERLHYTNFFESIENARSKLRANFNLASSKIKKLEKEKYKDKVSTLKSALIKTKSNINSKKLTGVHFHVPHGVEVYLDGVLVKNIKGPYIIKAGAYDLMMVKPGFNPITSKVYVIQDKITKINVK